MQSYLILALSITFILGFVSIHILNLIYNEQSTPYIDEIFHISQAQKYCNGNWTEVHVFAVFLLKQ